MHMPEINNYSSSFEAHLSSFESDALADELNSQGVIHFQNFLPVQLTKNLIAEADQLLNFHGKRVDTIVASTENTPRKYISVSRNSVFEHAPLIRSLYSDGTLVNFLEKLLKSPVIICPYEAEQIVVNKMDEEGDTHGWHWDDYTYSLVLVLDAPDQHNGAQVQYIDGTSWNKASAQVQHFLDTRPVQTLTLSSGSAYLLLGKRVMHRVSPLIGKDTRKIICFTYATDADRLLKVDHGSMEAIYG